MNNENEEVVVDTGNNEVEGKNQENEVTLKKEEYDKLTQTLGSLKRELKDLKKSKEETKETTEKTKPEENVLLQKLERLSLRQAGITEQEDIDLARNTAKKWGMDIDEVLADDDFKVKLEKQQTARANIQATAGIKGDNGSKQAKNTPEYWLAKGVPPTPTDIPDRKIRQSIVSAMMKSAKTTTSKFYND